MKILKVRMPWGRRRSSPVAGLLADPWAGLGLDTWTPTGYGDYLATSPVVYACIRLRAQNLSRVKLLLYRDSDSRTPGADVQVPSAHPAQVLLDHPNPFWSRQRFWQMVESSLGLYGSAPVAIFRDARGQPAELWWLHPARFRAVPDRSRYIQGYLYSRDGVDVAFAPRDILWFRYPNPADEHAPLSPIAALRMTIEMNRDAMRFNRRFFQNDATPGRTYIQAKADFSEPQLEAIRLRWEKNFKDTGQAHRLAIMDNSCELKTLGMAQREMEFVEGLRFSKEEICGAYGLSPILIGDLRMATLNNFQAAKASFWDEALLPEMELLESEVTASLLPQFAPSPGPLPPGFAGVPLPQRGEGQFNIPPLPTPAPAGLKPPDSGRVHLDAGLAAATGSHELEARFDISRISALREDQGRKAQRYEQIIRSGLMTVNEIRHQEGLPPVPWGDAPPERGPHPNLPQQTGEGT